MVKSKRWPWLTDGWEVVEDVEKDEQLEAAKDLMGVCRPPQFWRRIGGCAEY